MAHAPDKMSIGEDVEYKDSLSDIAFIAMCRSFTESSLKMPVSSLKHYQQSHRPRQNY